MPSISTMASFLLVGACWGCTTPFIKKGTSLPDEAPDARQESEKSGVLPRLLRPLSSLANPKAALPYLLNQSGSGLYYYLLGSQAVTAWAMGESFQRPARTLAGMGLVLVGIGVCILSKASTTVPQ